MRISKLPIIIGQGLHKGYLITPSQKMRGMDLWIVWLKRDVPSGEPFELEDIDKVETILRFCDRTSIDNMVKALAQMTAMWMTEKGDDDGQND